MSQTILKTASDFSERSPDALAELRHDLRTSVGHVIGYTDLLLEEAAESGAPASPDLQRIKSAGGRLLSLIDNRLTAGAAGVVAAPSAATVFATAAMPPASFDWGVESHGAIDTGAFGELDPDLTVGIVLVVDNVEENRDALARRLQRLGHLPVLVADGPSALAALEEQCFDLALLDVHMPGMDGFEVLRRIKANRRLARVPVLMTSALDDMASVARCIEMGAEDYLSKPIEPVLLKARVNACLRAKRARDRELRLADQLKTNYLKMQEAERLRDDLTGMIIHDLRTPLTSVLSGLQTMDVIGDLAADQHELLEISIDGAHTLLGMINDLLDIAKLEDGSLKLDRAPLNAGELVGRARRQVELLARERGLLLAEDVAGDIEEILADEDKLRRTLVNLVGNALKFTPSGGTVTVGAKRSSKEQGEPGTLFYVSDTGEGIPSDAFDRIFEKFGQVESRAAGHKMSTGLGLTFCRMAVEAHGGRIWVESEMGVGSTFFFAIPD